MFAILARSGCFLPKCLTFVGPHNGPEDFAFATDRAFAPGRGRKRRICSEWLIYADDITIRTGRVVDGVLYTESEWNERLKASIKKQPPQHQQALEEAFRSLGFDPKELGKELNSTETTHHKTTKGGKAVKGLGKVAGSNPSPYAH